MYVPDFLRCFRKAIAGLTKEEEAAEEQKLYAAIGYSESDAPVKLPPEVSTAVSPIAIITL